MSLVSVDFKFPDLYARMLKGKKRLLLAIAANIQKNRGLLFDAEGAYNGHPKWKDLKSKLNLKKAKNGMQSRQILRHKGTLKNSIAPASADGKAGPGGYVHYTGDSNKPVVKVGTEVAYARIHNEGGIVKHPGTSNGFGRGIKIPAHQIPIPRRNFTDWNGTDNANLKKVLKNTLQEILSGR